MKKLLYSMCVVFLLAPGLVHAATWTVTSGADTYSGGTLREAVNNASSGDSIVVDPSVSSIVITKQISIAKTLEIQGHPLLTIVSATPHSYSLFNMWASSAHLTLRDLRVYNFGSSAVRIDGGATINVYDSHFENNHGSFKGGALYSTGAIIIRDSTFYDNEAAQGGGAVFADDTTIWVAYSDFTGNLVTGSGSGGAIAAAGGSSPGRVTIIDSLFENNEAPDKGGAINVNGKSLTVSGGLLISNTSQTSGGAIHSCGDLSVTHSHFGQNEAIGPGAYYGGAIGHNCDSDLSITESSFDGNAVVNTGNGPANGGALAILGGGPTQRLIRNSTFTNNSANLGGAIHHYSSTVPPAFRHLTIVNNTATSRGGGLAADNFGATSSTGDVELYASIVANNTAPVDEDCSGTVHLFEVNNIRKPGSTVLLGPGWYITPDPDLGPLLPLAGMVTHGMMPKQPSPVVDVVGTLVEVHDQHYKLRHAGAPKEGDGNPGTVGYDIGALERQTYDPDGDDGDGNDPDPDPQLE